MSLEMENQNNRTVRQPGDENIEMNVLYIQWWNRLGLALKAK